jgi:hypothetical protein
MQLINELAARLIFSKATGCDINKTIGLFERWFKDGTGKIDAEELGLMIALEVSIQGNAMSFQEVDLRRMHQEYTLRRNRERTDQRNNAYIDEMHGMPPV